MNINEIKIVTDSSSDLLFLEGIPFGSAPLKIITAEKEYVDDKNLDVAEMVADLSVYKGRSSTSCPNTGDWLEAFGDTKYVFVVTITATLSGSYNSAVLAKNYYEELYPDRKVFVLNSLSAGPEMALIIDKIQELAVEGLDFDDVCEKITEYSKTTGLLFILESMKNLANNGRVSPLAARVAGVLGIRVLGKASDKGDLQQLAKARGQEKALQTTVEQLEDLGLKNGRVKIAHCENQAAAQKLKALIETNFQGVQTEVYSCRGLCSFYAEKGGMLIGFEKN